MLICVTNRQLCAGDFLTQLEQIVRAKPTAVLLREKDLSPEEYQLLVAAVTPMMKQHGVPLWCYHPDVATKTDGGSWHLPYSQFRSLLAQNQDTLKHQTFGVSIHAADEAERATSHGASYLIAGHIFATDCKQGMAGRGLPFLQEIVAATQTAAVGRSPQDGPPIYAIGGVTPERCPEIRQAGASGVCVMSALMKSENPAALVRAYQAQWENGSP